jgi:hypothetical protein
MTEREVIDEFFRRHSTSRLMWELHAVTLRYAMETLFQQVFADTAVALHHRTRKSLRPSLHGPALMLAGMMLEAAAKAVLTARGTALKPDGTPISKDHDLVALADSIGLSSSGDDRFFLKRMSEFVRWAGRYPAPTKASRMAVTTPGGHLEIVGGSSIGDDLRRARQLADKMEALLPGARLRIGMRLPSGNARVSRRRRSARSKREAAQQ